LYNRVHVVVTTGCVYTDVPPYSTRKMNESIEEYLRCLWHVVAGV